MNSTAESYLLLLSQLPHAKKVALTARCARIVVNLQHSMSLPVSLRRLSALEEVVRLVEESISGNGDLAELRSSMHNLRDLAYSSPAQTTFPSETVICQVIRAAYEAGLTAITGLNSDAQDSLDAAFAAARAAESKPAEDSLWEELRRVRREAIQETSLKMRMLCNPTETDQAIN